MFYVHYEYVIAQMDVYELASTAHRIAVFWLFSNYFE